MILTYGCEAAHAGSEVALWINDLESVFEVAGTGGWTSWAERRLGAFDLIEGVHRVVIQPRKPANGAMLNVKSVRLVPAKRQDRP